MKRFIFVVAAAAAAPILPTAGSTRGAPVRETVTVAADEPIPNLPGKRLISVIVDYPPGASSAPHRHARSAFIYAYVVSGEIRRDHVEFGCRGHERNARKKHLPPVRAAIRG